MNILSGIISTILSLVISVVLGFFLLIALNGFSGRAGEYAIFTYLICAVIIALTVGAISVLSAGFFIKKGWNTALAVILPIVVALILSVVGNFIGMAIAGIVADTMWKK